MSEYLFSYGTLQQKKTQQELFGRILKGAADILQGYKIATIEIADQNFLVKGEEKFQATLIKTGNENDSVKGIVFEITDDELLTTDKYEPNNYKRIKLKFKSGKQAWVYIASS
jgi:gamma-glutamylcyclotransferase (GGCT)/AIG2-like uncharacterized protein YtfP